MVLLRKYQLTGKSACMQLRRWLTFERKLAASNWKLAPLNLKIRGTKKLHVITKTGIFPKFQLCFIKKFHIAVSIQNDI